MSKTYDIRNTLMYMEKMEVQYKYRKVDANIFCISKDNRCCHFMRAHSTNKFWIGLNMLNSTHTPGMFSFFKHKKLYKKLIFNV